MPGGVLGRCWRPAKTAGPASHLAPSLPPSLPLCSSSPRSRSPQLKPCQECTSRLAAARRRRQACWPLNERSIYTHGRALRGSSHPVRAENRGSGLAAPAEPLCSTPARTVPRFRRCLKPPAEAFQHPTALLINTIHLHSPRAGPLWRVLAFPPFTPTPSSLLPALTCVHVPIVLELLLLFVATRPAAAHAGQRCGVEDAWLVLCRGGALMNRC